jgi:hypothetical protein
MNKNSIPVFFLGLSLVLFSIHYLVGSHLDSNGFLIEPAFFCLPLGYLSLLLSFLTGLKVLYKSRSKKK